MPPKPPFRIPVKPPAAPKPKVLTFAKAAPRAPPKPSKPQTQSHITPPPPPKPRHQNRTFAHYAAWSANVVVGLCAFIWVRDHHVSFDSVCGSSMAPTLNPLAHETGSVDWVVIRPNRRGQAVSRGDIVTFWKPHKPKEVSIKRVVAVEGDTVYPRRGYALEPSSHKGRVQGLPDGLLDADPEAVGSGEDVLGKVIVPYGHVWVEGDNWRQSLDSNDFGPISKGLIEGRAVWIWRSWFGFKAVGDERAEEDKTRSRVVHGRSEIPTIFLE